MILGGKKIKISTGDDRTVAPESADRDAALNGEERDADFTKFDGGENSGSSEVGGDEGSTAVGDNGGGEAQLRALQAEVADHKDKYLRALAEFENYKKRALKERSELIKYQGERVIGDFLEVLDNVELDLNHAESDPKKLSEGLKLIHKMFVDTLGRWEVRADSAMGADFDPVKHKAISRMAVPNAKPGTVVGELKKPYFYKDKLLRPGEVVVASEPLDVGSEGAPGGSSTEG